MGRTALHRRPTTYNISCDQTLLERIDAALVPGVRRAEFTRRALEYYLARIQVKLMPRDVVVYPDERVFRAEL